MRIDWARLGILLRDGGREGGGVGFISGGTGGSLKIQVGNVKYIYIIILKWLSGPPLRYRSARGCGGGGGVER